jgi:hypothetical protein
MFAVSVMSANLTATAATVPVTTTVNNIDTRQLVAVPEQAEELNSQPDKNIFEGSVTELNFDLKTISR